MTAHPKGTSAPNQTDRVARRLRPVWCSCVTAIAPSSSTLTIGDPIVQGGQEI
jgi:hypothetical protein